MNINGKDYQDIFHLASDMYLSSDYFAKELRRDTLLSFIKKVDEEKYEKIVKLSLLSLPDDVFVFKASYILNPFMSLRIKGFCFKDFKELGETILAFSPNPNPVLSQLLRYSLLSKHMENTYFQETNKETYEKVLQLEKISETQLPYAYFSLGYYLSRKTTIIYEGKEYQDIFDLTYFLCKQEKDLDSIGAYLSKSPLLKAYSEYGKNSKKMEEYLHICEEVDKSERKLDEFLNKKKRRKISEE